MMEISVRAVWINLPLCLYKVILVLGNIALRVIDTRVAFDFEFAIFKLLDTIYQLTVSCLIVNARVGSCKRILRFGVVVRRLRYQSDVHAISWWVHLISLLTSLTLSSSQIAYSEKNTYLWGKGWMIQFKKLCWPWHGQIYSLIQVITDSSSCSSFRFNTILYILRN